MNIYISKQSLEVGSFKRRLLEWIGVEYSFLKPELEEQVEEPKEEHTDVSELKSVLLETAIKDLSVRADNTIRYLLGYYQVELKDFTVKEFVDRFSIIDIMKIRVGGKVTIDEICKMVETYGYKLRES